MSYNVNSKKSGIIFPVGGIVAWVSSTIPNGWALCDGSTFNSTTYSVLFGLLGTNTLPNLKGTFLRNVGSGSYLSKTYTGPSLRGTQTDTYLNHTHGVNDPGHTHTYTQAGFGAINVGDGSSTNRAGDPGTYNMDTGSSGIIITIANNSTDTETAPYCYGINWIIKLG